MSNKFNTFSEELFYNRCKNLGYRIEKIPETTVKTADFRIWTPSTEIIAEVKEIKVVEEIDKYGIITGSHKIGKITREKIKKASKQLGRYKDKHIPCILVLYERSEFNEKYKLPSETYLSPTEIAISLYGDYTVSLGKNIPLESDILFQNGSFKKDRKDYISAVVVLLTDLKDTIKVYHNYYAKIPLDISNFKGENILHFKTDNPRDVKTWYLSKS